MPSSHYKVITHCVQSALGVRPLLMMHDASLDAWPNSDSNATDMLVSDGILDQIKDRAWPAVSLGEP